MALFKNPAFYQRLDVCVKNNEKLAAISSSNTPKFLQFLQKFPIYLSHGWQLLQLYLMKPIDAVSAHGQAR